MFIWFKYSYITVENSMSQSKHLIKAASFHANTLIENFECNDYIINNL